MNTIDHQVVPSVHLPWYLSCNKERYPYWLGKSDPRNWDLLQAFPAMVRSIDEVSQVYSVASPVERLFPTERITDPQDKTKCLSVAYIEDPFALE